MLKTIEVINPNIPRGAIRCAVFDFDGTLSLLRAGWMAIMTELMLDALSQTRPRESADELRGFVTDVIYNTSGQQTIYQMMRLAEEVRTRGGTPETPQAYKQRFADCVLARVNERLGAIQAGVCVAEEWLVPGTRPLLTALRARGVVCYIASGTDEPHVRREAARLGLAPYFAGIFGAADADYKNHSKRVVIRNLVAQHGLRPGELLAFGDGAPEIADTKAVGGIAVGVASDEERRHGVHPRKRATLLDAGADIIVPDFREWRALIDYLFCANAKTVL